MIYFTAQDNFVKALDEVKTLIDLASQNSNDNKKYSLFLRAGILFLTTKLEVFLENISKEYVGKITKCDVSCNNLAEEMILSAINEHLSKSHIIPQLQRDKTKCLNIPQLQAKKTECLKELRAILPLLDPTEKVTKLDVNTRFNYGKHGKEEVENLFERIGHKGIFDKCSISKKQLTYNAESQQDINIIGDLEALKNIRNKIIHEDYISTNLTPFQIQGYLDNLTLFADKVSEHLNNELVRLRNVNSP
ncbi:hypothetical protein MCHI_001576 [Candidatus Magnetoovum chiemensis]|nr:hypothetical protein MCHI_001576 [Candidatus Magnetoovum chiemensis]